MTAISAKQVTKTFGQTTALNKASFKADFGQVQAVVGENGAGKTTLMRAFRGEIEIDSGEIHIEGGFESVGMVSQHYAIIPELTCLENLMLGSEPSFLIKNAIAEQRARELANKLGFQFDWQALAETLSPSSAQKLEILKLLWRNSRIMILDEPTAMLSPADSQALFESLKQLADEGACVIIVTHRVSEVLDHCSRVTVLRHGETIAELETSTINGQELAELIVGRGIVSTQVSPAVVGENLIEAEELEVRGHRGDMAVKKVTFSVHKGEVVGIAGVDGSGQRELFQALIGTKRVESGSLKVLGHCNSTTAGRLAGGMRVIPEDRNEDGLIEDWSLEENALLGLQQLNQFRSGPLIDFPSRRTLASKVVDLFGTKIQSTAQTASELSGGNQQRFVAGRALSEAPRLILAFQPARGLDLAGVSSVYSAIRTKCREQNAGALIVGYDIDELLEYCDRIVVMSRGRLTTPSPEFQRDRTTLGRLMVEVA